MKTSFLFLFLATSAVPAMAHDWCAVRAETAAEVSRARAEAKLGCFEINALIDQQRMMANQMSPARIPSYFMPRPAPSSAVVPTAGLNPTRVRTR